MRHSKVSLHKFHWGQLAVIGMFLLTMGGLFVLGWIAPANASPALAPNAQYVPTGTPMYFPLVMKQYPPTSTLTPTPTATNTLTPTVTNTGTLATPTPTATNTQTPTATNTGTLPTPTRTPTITPTGTLTPNPVITVAVTPYSAKVNQRFTFTITIINTGALPAINAVLSDSFPAYLDVETATLSPAAEGTVTKGSHSVSVSLGTINIGETNTISIVAKVNSGATTTETISNIVTLTYGSGLSRTASVSYRVEGSSLPSTGELPLDARPPNIDWSVLFLSLALGLVGIFAIWYGIWAKRVPTEGESPAVRQPGGIQASIVIGMMLVVLSVAAGAWGIGLWTGQPEPLPVVFVETTIPSATPQQLAGYDIEPINPAQLPGAPEFRFGTPYPTLPSYPIPTPNVIPTSIGTQAPDISPVVRIVVPALSLDTEVKYVPFDGLTWLISGLRQEIAWLGNTSWPGLGGNTVLAGHVTVRGMGDGPFRYLDQMKVDDEITIYTENNIYLYRVREQTVVEEGDLWVTDPTENAQLTLITCTDWNQDLSQYIRRLIVFADLVRVEPLHTAGSN